MAEQSLVSCRGVGSKFAEWVQIISDIACPFLKYFFFHVIFDYLLTFLNILWSHVKM